MLLIILSPVKRNNEKFYQRIRCFRIRAYRSLALCGFGALRFVLRASSSPISGDRLRLPTSFGLVVRLCVCRYPMASDGTQEVRFSGRRPSESGYCWVSSSPSPATVALLEERFPEVVRIPVALLEEETAGWQQRAVLVRSFSKWVPVEAYIREFRRAGISGTIEPVSLAFRCHIFRFENQEACSMVLNRPWVINGQFIGAEAWRPDFFPSSDSIPSAMVWIRLPNLPLEFWQEEVLRSVVAPAGVFCYVDAATKSRNRGGYARVAVRVDLRHPLRPGTRVQGLCGPFWQSYVFESLEGICPRCGSLHIASPCSSVATAEEEDPAGGAIFGPWMAALRQRRAVNGARYSNLEAVPGRKSVSQSGAQNVNSDAGWKFQSKKGRRVLKTDQLGEGFPQSMHSGMKSSVSVDVKGQQQKSSEGQVEELQRGVPFQQKRAGADTVAQGRCFLNKGGLAESSTSISMADVNPFASLSSVFVDGVQEVTRDMLSGPLKRARPLDNPPPRAISKAEKKKGKGKGKLVNCRVDLIPSPTCLAKSSTCQVIGQEMVSVNQERQGAKEGEVSHDSSSGQGLVNIEIDSVDQMVCPSQCSEDGSLSDNYMAEDKQGGLSTST